MKLMYISGVKGLFLKLFTLTLLKIFFLKCKTCSKNSGLSLSADELSRFCKSFSFSIGLTMAKQSLSLK